MTSSSTSNHVTDPIHSSSATFATPLLSSSATLTAQSQPQIRPPPLRSTTNHNSNPNHPPIFLSKSVNHGGGGASTTPSFYPSVGHTRALYPRPIPDRTVTIANSNHGGGGYIRNSSSIGQAGTAATPQQQAGMPGGPHLSMRPPPQQQFLGLRQTPAAHKSVPPPFLGSGVQLKNAPLPGVTVVSEKFLNERDKSNEEAVVTVHGRKVTFSEENSDSLYALCRSWVRNGYYQDNQPKVGDSLKILPKPLQAKSSSHLQVTSEHAIDAEISNKDEDIGCVEQLTEEDLLKGHIKRAKAIRARLRRERMMRIERFKQRLSILLPSHRELMARTE